MPLNEKVSLFLCITESVPGHGLVLGWLFLWCVFAESALTMGGSLFEQKVSPALGVDTGLDVSREHRQKDGA